MDKATLNDKGGLDFDDAPDNKPTSLEKILDLFFDKADQINEQSDYSYLDCRQQAEAAIAELYETAVPEKQYNDILKLRKLSPWQRMKARATIKSRNNTIDQIHANFKQIRGGKL